MIKFSIRRWTMPSVRTLGSELGSASVIVIDDTVSVDWIINKTIHFFKHESCGKCTPCREGTYWMQNITERIHSGKGTQGDVDLLLNVAKQMQGKCLCPLGEFSTMAVVTGIERFPQDFKKAVKAITGCYWQTKQVTLSINGITSNRA